MGRLGIALFGPMLVTRDSRLVTGFEYDKVRALLAFLTLEAERPHRRETVAGLLWPEQPEKVARDSLRNALATLRKAIGDDDADPPYLLITREAIQFNTSSDHVLDTTEFARNLGHAAHHRHRDADSCRACAGWRRESVDHYHGPLLAQFSLPDSPEFETWLVARRESFHYEALDGMQRLAAFYLRRGDYQAAHYFASRQLAFEPWHEAAHRQAMLALALMGNRSGALKQYETCRTILAEELGVLPEPETMLLWERIRDRNVVGAGSGRNVLAPATPLVGREHDLEALYRKLVDPDIHLLTIVGLGGVGKTSLALAAGHQFGADFADGSVFVSLAATRRPADFFSTIAAALGLIPEPNTPIGQQVADYLEERNLLLILDNFEQLLDGAVLLTALMAAAPGLVLLVTSRQRLGLSTEWAYELQGLAYPAEESNEPLAEHGAIQLFARRARQVRDDFALLSAETVAVAEICRLVHGMPLAIELAAAATAVLPVTQIVGQLRDGLDMLSAEWADLPPRHHSIRAVFDQSWIWLSDDERFVLRHLSVFSGSFDAEAASSVAGTTPADLRRLHEKSLLQVREDGRFGLHPLIRAYAAEQLSAREENITARQRHLNYLIKVAEKGEQALKGQEQLQWINRLEADHANILAALTWARDNDYTGAVQLASAMWLFWFMRGHLRTSREHYERLYVARDKLPLRLRARLLNAYTSTIMGQSDMDYIEAVAQEALTCYVELGDHEGIALSYHHLAIAAREQGHPEESIVYATQSISSAQRAAEGRPIWELTVAQGTLASTLTYLGRFEEAEALVGEEARTTLRAKDRWGWSYALAKLANIALDKGDFDTARAELQQVLGIAREYRDRRLVAYAALQLGIIALQQDDLAEAWQQIESTERHYSEVGDRSGQAKALELLGDIFRQRGFIAKASAHYREVQETYVAIGDSAAARRVGEKLVEIEKSGG